MTQALIPIENSYRGVTFKVGLRMILQEGGPVSWSYVLWLPPADGGSEDEVFTSLKQFDDDALAFAGAQSWARNYIDAGLGSNGIPSLQS